MSEKKIDNGNHRPNKKYRKRIRSKKENLTLEQRQSLDLLKADLISFFSDSRPLGDKITEFLSSLSLPGAKPKGLNLFQSLLLLQKHRSGRYVPVPDEAFRFYNDVSIQTFLEGQLKQFVLQNLKGGFLNEQTRSTTRGAAEEGSNPQPLPEL